MQNVFTPGTPDLIKEPDVPESLLFQTAQDQPSLIPERVEPEHPELKDLMDLGALFASKDLPN